MGRRQGTVREAGEEIERERKRRRKCIENCEIEMQKCRK
jgi:hypothetical protein